MKLTAVLAISLAFSSLKPRVDKIFRPADSSCDQIPRSKWVTFVSPSSPAFYIVILENSKKKNIKKVNNIRKQYKDQHCKNITLQVKINRLGSDKHLLWYSDAEA